MSRTWKSVGLAVLSLSLFVATGARTSADEKSSSDKLKTTEQRLTDLELEMKLLKQGLRADFDKIGNDIASIKNAVTALKPVSDLSVRLVDLEDILKRTNQRIDTLQDAVRELDRNVRTAPPPRGTLS